VLAVLKQHDLHLKAIVITHAHIDHIGGAAKLKAATGAPVYMNAADQDLYDHLDMQASWIGLPTPETTAIDHPRATATLSSVVQLSCNCCTRPATPRAACASSFPPKTNSSPATRCSAIPSPYRPAGGDSRQLLRSIHNRLLTLDEDLDVFPGHGPETTIGHERNSTRSCIDHVRRVVQKVSRAGDTEANSASNTTTKPTARGRHQGVRRERRRCVPAPHPNRHVPCGPRLPRPGERCIP